MKTIKTPLLLTLVALVCLSACSAAGTGEFTTEEPAGFIYGFWHGFIAWFTFIGSLCGIEVKVYETFNNGVWYDLGFLLAVGGSSGGAASVRSGRSE